MIVEKEIRKYLKEQLNMSVEFSTSGLSGEYVIIEKVGGSKQNGLTRGSVAFKSYADNLMRAIEIDKMVRDAMEDAPNEININSAKLASNYNFTDTATKKHRYQAVFDITYFEE